MLIMLMIKSLKPLPDELQLIPFNCPQLTDGKSAKTLKGATNKRVANMRSPSLK